VRPALADPIVDIDALGQTISRSDTQQHGHYKGLFHAILLKV